jgi:RES domain-containing protein
MAARGQLVATNITVHATDEHCFRATGTGTDALTLSESNMAGSRYDRPGASQSFYACRGRHVVPIELERRAGVPVAHFRLTLARVKATLLDAHSREALMRLGLRRDDLVQPDNSICLELADVGRAAGCDGLLVPSVAVDGEVVVVIWREAVPDAVSIVSWTIVSAHCPESTGTDDWPLST